MENVEFLKILYGKVPDGGLSVSYIVNGNITTKWFDVSELEDMSSFLLETGKTYNTYYGVNPRKKKLSTYIRGSDKDIGYVVAIQNDYDIAGEAHKEKELPRTKEELLSFIDTIPIKPSMLIWSGNGIHALWLFEVPYEMGEDTSYINWVLKGWEAYVNTEARSRYGWKFDSVADTARMLRAPGTINHKTKDRPACEVISYSDDRYRPEDFEKYIDADFTVAKKTVAAGLDTDDFALMGAGNANELIEKCEFIQYCKDNAVDLSEQYWFGGISNLSCCSNGREVIHEISKP